MFLRLNPFIINFFKKYCFLFYFLAACLLGGYLYFLHQEQKDESILYREVDKVMEEMIDIESSIFSRKCRDLAYDRDNLLYEDQLYIEKYIKELEDKMDSLRYAYKNARQACFGAKWMSESNFEISTPKDFTKINKAREDLYAFFDTVLADTTMRSSKSAVGTIEKVNLNTFEHAPLYQDFMQNRNIELIDIENAMRFLQVFYEYRITHKVPVQERLIPFLQLENDYLKIGDVAKGEIFAGKLRNHLANTVFRIGKDTLENRDEVGILKKRFSSAGTKEMDVNISHRNPYTGKVDNFRKRLKVNVKE